MLNQNLKKEMLKNIDITRDAAKNSFEIMLDSYIEITNRLNLQAYIIMQDDKQE